jgi:hypothetical protein
MSVNTQCYSSLSKLFNVIEMLVAPNTIVNQTDVYVALLTPN